MITTERLYVHDSYTTQFTARVMEAILDGDRPALVLDRTYFYPTSGGQPHDTGLINGLEVLDVAVREADGAVLHTVAGEPIPPVGAAVTGAVNWARRLDHMQHHTGQHILTWAFVQAAAAGTVSFHLGEEAATIDLDRPDLTPAQIDAAEDLANAAVGRNLPVRAWYPTAGELANLPLRKVPVIDGQLRVVSIGDLDCTACGGTHVAHTGEIGLIKVTRAEKYKDMTRVEFRCGTRALRDYRHKHALLQQVAADLTIGFWELPAAIARLQAEIKQLRADWRAARQRLLALDAQELWETAAERNGVRVVVRAWEAADRQPDELPALASRLIQEPQTVALLGLAGEKAQIVMARSPDLPDLDLVPWLRGVTGALAGGGQGRGGGRPDFAQGGGMSADLPALAAVLRQAGEAILAAANG